MRASRGQTLGAYVLRQRIGRGGSGEVWVAEHRVTERRYAIKLLASWVDPDEVVRQRFAREIKASACIGHPGIVRVLDHGFDEPTRMLYLVMELLEGRTYGTWCDERDPPPSARLLLLSDLLGPLAAAHRLKTEGKATPFVHRDLKPDNVFVLDAPIESADGRKQRVKLLDFGIARQLGVATKSLTVGGLGTVGYLSPEQAREAKDVGPSADVFSVGVMLYEAVAGVAPFRGDSASEIMAEVLTGQPDPLRSHAPHVDRTLAALIHRCIAFDPELRPRDAGVLGDSLERLLARQHVLRSVDATGLGGHGTFPDLASTELASPISFSMPSVKTPRSPTPTLEPVQIKGVAVRSLLAVMRDRDLADAIRPELREEVDRGILASSWYPIPFYRGLHEAAQASANAGQELARELAREAVARDFEGVYRFVAGVLQAEWVIAWTPRQFRRYFRGGEVEVEEVRSGYGRVTFEACEGFDPIMWEDMLGSLEAIIAACGGAHPVGRLVRGGAHRSATFELTWGAS